MNKIIKEFFNLSVYKYFIGHASLVGQNTYKILAFTTRNLYCNKCKNVSLKKHDCRKNHTGSLKSMEADMAVELVLKNNDLVNANFRIKTFIGDDDSSSIAALRRLSTYVILKSSDFNHVSKTFNSKLYDLKLTASIR